MAIYIGSANSNNKFSGNHSSDPSSSLAEGDLFYHTGDDAYKYYNGSEWIQLAAAGADGTQLRPFTTMTEMAQAVAPDGNYYVKLSGMASAIQTYVKKVNNVYYALAAIVTNQDGDTANWFANDTTVSSNSSNASNDLFVNNSDLNVNSMTNITTKDNAKNSIFYSTAFNKLLIREDHNGSIGEKAYTLNASKKFGGTSGTRWFTHQSGNRSSSTTSNVVSSVTYSSGSFTTWTTSNLYFDYVTANDGGRLIAATISSEASGGWCSRVDGHSGYAWRGNLTRSDGNRHYNSDGTTTNHTSWFFINNGT